MRKSKNPTINLLAILIVIYLVIDIVHFFLYRKKPVYMEFAEAIYEDVFISFLKWILCIIILYGLYLEKHHKEIVLFFDFKF